MTGWRGAPRRLRSCALFLTVFNACGPPTDSAVSTVADSAGVRITETRGVPDVWRLSADPVLSLGVVDEGGPTEFFQVRGIELLPGGGVAVANRGSEEVRVFDAAGGHTLTFGREGRGPREFLRLSMLQDRADSLVVYDSGNDRFQLRDASGAFYRSFRLEWFTGALLPVDLSAEGRILAITARYMTELRGTGLLVDTALVSLYDMEGALVDSIARVPHNVRFVKQVGDMRTTLGAPFASEGHLISYGEGFCYAFGSAHEVHCYDARGTLVRIARFEGAGRSVTEFDVEAYWSSELAEAEGSYRDALLRLRADMVFPDSFPAFDALLADDRGRIWAQAYRIPHDPAPTEAWWVLQDDRLAATLHAPEGLEVMDVEGSLVAGVWRDELGVEFVRVYQLATPP